MTPGELLAQARIQLMLGHPFLASAVAAYPLVETDRDWCQTMATDGIAIYARRSWVCSLAPAHLQFVLAHEVMHCVLGHLDRKGSREMHTWNVATDLATNLFLNDAGLECPPEGLLRRGCRGLTAEQVYDQLLTQRRSLASPDGGPGSADGSPQQRAAAEAGHSAESSGGKKDAHKGEGEPDSWDRGWSDGRFDEHLDPGDPRAAQLRPHESPSQEERRRLRRRVWQDMSTKLHGSLKGAVQADIAAATSPQVSWRELLARFVAGIRRSDYRLFPFNRKHLWRGFYLPSVGVPGPEWLVAAVDTSGSISDKDIAMFLAELDAVRVVSECRVTLIQCDAAIQRVEEFQPFEPPAWNRAGEGVAHKIFGRGGTDFRPVFEWIAEQAKFSPLPDALIYMTDGFGDFPDKAPAFEVLWLLTQHSVEKVPFGEVIMHVR